ncbi:hypothetical protein CO670_02255 [Rhizobium sp. J15]|nr:hypothetical protein CO670_02255 [Rhizobium sp. J15]
MPCGPLIRPFGPPTGVEPRVSTRPSDPRWGEGGARGTFVQFIERGQSATSIFTTPSSPD